MLVSATYPSLCHYTTAAGLEGIIREQQLRATNIGFLNDSEERIGYFKRRLPRLLKEPVHDGVLGLWRTPKGKKAIVNAGGKEKAEEELVKHFCDEFQRHHEQLDEPYIASFCVSDTQHQNDGLLSQWRGYGEDGGYAITFNTRGIEELSEKEQKFYYQAFFLSDVEYGDPTGNGVPRFADTVRFEDDVKEAVRQFTMTQSREAFVPMYTAMAALPCLYKHHGFREEAEVRIVAVPIHD
jgi:hypothetical protein